tara:strand:+ start:1430 stop:1657 length:228 start_codon:yes stop_codon:yes gene_type:complete
MNREEEQLELFDTTDQFGNDTHAAPKLPKVDKGFKARFIDPKNQTNLGDSYFNLGNHILIIGFIAMISFVVYASY